MSGERLDPADGKDDSTTSALDFFTRRTGVTGTVTFTVTTQDGEKYSGSSRADLNPDDIGSGLARLSCAATRILGADIGDRFHILIADLEKDLAHASEKLNDTE